MVDRKAFSRRAQTNKTNGIRLPGERRILLGFLNITITHFYPIITLFRWIENWQHPVGGLVKLCVCAWLPLIVTFHSPRSRVIDKLLSEGRWKRERWKLLGCDSVEGLERGGWRDKHENCTSPSVPYQFSFFLSGRWTLRVDRAQKHAWQLLKWSGRGVKRNGTKRSLTMVSHSFSVFPINSGTTERVTRSTQPNYE